MVLGFLFSTSSAFGARNHTFSKTIGEPGHGAGQLELVAPEEEFAFGHGQGSDIKGGSGVAVNDVTGDVYVADTGNHRIDEFNEKGEFVLAFGKEVDATTKGDICTAASKDVCKAGVSGSEPGELESPVYIAVDNSPGGEGDVYVGDTGDDRVTKFGGDGGSLLHPDGVLDSEWGNGGAGGSANGQLVGPPTETFTALTRDRRQRQRQPLDRAAKAGTAAELFKFEQSGTYTMIHFEGPGEPSGLAVNPAEELYLADGFPNVRKFTAAGVEVGELFPDGGSNFTGLAVDEKTNVVYLDREDAVLAVSGSCPPPKKECEVLESFGAPQLSAGAGVAVDPETDTVYAANTATDVVDVFPLEPVAVPLLTGESSADVTATSAKLAGEVDPRSLAGEAETEYWFEYTTETQFAREGFAGAARTAAGTLAPSFDAVPVTAEVQNLVPNTAYRYRLVAKNAVNTGTGEELAFTTQGSGTFALPDGRQWELVSPVEKHGALIEPIAQEGIIQAAADGGAITYHANQATEPGVEGAMNEVQILSTRTSSGWSTRDIEPSHGASGKPEGHGETYRFFSEDLKVCAGAARGRVRARTLPGSLRTDTAAAQQLSGQYERTVHPHRGRLLQGAGHREQRNVPPEIHFGDTGGLGLFGPCPQAGIFCGPELVGASPDGQHPVFESYAQLTTTPIPPNSGGELYEYNHGTIAQVSILPDGEAPENAVLGFFNEDTRHAISEDGERVVFEAGNTTSGYGIYLRENAAQPQSPIENGTCTDPADACTVSLGGGEFQTANSETTKIFYTTGGDLYEYTIGTSEPVPLTEKGKVLEGAVVGVSENGEYVYFVANGTLKSAAEGAVAGNCKRAQSPGQLCNLYVEHNGVTRLIAVLSGEDRPDWANESMNLTNLTARVAPDGRYLAFMSDRDLDGYDTADADSGHPDEEVYLYDADTGRLACASCDPTGARPHGHYYYDGGVISGQPGMRLVGGSKIWEPSSSLAANVPGLTPYDLTKAAYQSRYLSNEGRLFFNSYGALVPKDGNGNWDVYEYEPKGVPAGGEHPCGPESASGSVAYKPAREYKVAGSGGAPAVSGEEPEGCVGLISSGASNEESAFLDASESGSDVFFLTTAPLESQDTDTAYDVYDAHECTTTSPCIPPPAVEPAPVRNRSLVQSPAGAAAGNLRRTPQRDLQRPGQPHAGLDQEGHEEDRQMQAKLRPQEGQKQTRVRAKGKTQAGEKVKPGV